jgi:heme/copper-type cytochrome/quinol oxidase subunit 2
MFKMAAVAIVVELFVIACVQKYRVRRTARTALDELRQEGAEKAANPSYSAVSDDSGGKA